MVEGVRSVEALVASPIRVVGLLVSDALSLDPRGAALAAIAEAMGVPITVVTPSDLEDAASTDSPQGVLAVAEIPERQLETPVSLTGRYLLLDAIQDPGNVGTMVRTAAALGVTATMVLPGTVDVWNAKVVRSSMGALFVHPVLAASWEDVTAFLHANDIACWAADANGLVIDSTDDLRRDALPARLALVVSNEGAGLSGPAAACASRRVAISMAPGVESLNVAVATGILLHALRPADVRMTAGRTTH